MSAAKAHCTVCPRHCGVDRALGERGYCGEADEVRIAFAGLHFGEEPPITAGAGSGTVFFTGCNLRCSFCQNYQVSQCGMGRAVSCEEFVRICLALQAKGAANINLVTASHIAPRLAAYLAASRAAGVTLPYCWNSSAYECTETLECLKGLVAVWLPDLKTLSPAISARLFAAPDYGKAATRAIEWMIANNPLRFEDGGENANSRLLSGVIVRHLFLPGCFAQTADVLDWLHNHADGRAIISLMTQYTPIAREGAPACGTLDAANANIDMEDRFVNMQEITDLREIAEAYNFERLYYQDLTEEDIRDTSWLPDFNNVHTFPHKLSVPVWHWRAGFV